MSKNKRKVKKLNELSKADVEAFRPFVWDACQSAEEIHKWILVTFGLDMPNCTVDPQSNSNPIEMIWEVYQTAMDGLEEDRPQFMAYASRDSFKTLSCAMLEVLMMIHAERSIAHMAAIKPQSKKSQQYVKKFLNRPLLREFVTSKNDTTVEITRFRNKQNEQEVIAEKKWQEFPLEVADDYEELRQSDDIIICTLAGANSAHVPFMVVDEVDTVEDFTAFEEAKMIPAPLGDKLPITLYTSTRKFAFGLVQQELDKAEETKLQIRHWNIIDVTRRCEPERHKPELPRVNLYTNDDTLKHLTEAEWKALPPEDQTKYTLMPNAFAGCATCKLFPACKGNLVNQKSNSPLLKPISHTINQLKKVSVATAKAQYLCWKPSTEGLIYPALDPEVHKKTAAELAQMMTGEEYPETFTKNDLINLTKTLGYEFRGGMDFGSSHCFATGVGIKYGSNLYMIHCHEVADLDVVQQSQLIEWERDNLNPHWWPDMAALGNIKTLKRWGHRLGTWKKTAGSVLAGIEDVRANLRPAAGTPNIYFLKDDPGVELLFKRLKEYHWKKGSDNKSTDIPDDADDDHCDMFRYLVMNELKNRVQGVKMDASEIKTNPIQSMNTHEIIPRETYVSSLIDEALGYGHRVSLEDNTPHIQKNKKSGIKWSI
jgi:hypothetical protein